MNQLYIVTKEFGTQNANDFHSNRELRYSIRMSLTSLSGTF